MEAGAPFVIQLIMDHTTCQCFIQIYGVLKMTFLVYAFIISLTFSLLCLFWLYYKLLIRVDDLTNVIVNHIVRHQDSNIYRVTAPVSKPSKPSHDPAPTTTIKQKNATKN